MIIFASMIFLLTLACIFMVLYRYIYDCNRTKINPDTQVNRNTPGNLIWKLLGSFIPILHLYIIYYEAKNLR